MFSKFALLEESNCILGVDQQGERFFNGLKFPVLHEKMKKLEKKYCPFLKEDPVNLLLYSLHNPIKLVKDRENKFQIEKDKLNDLLIESEEKRMHRDIYKSKLYELLNPYHLVIEKKYISENNISREIRRSLQKDKQEKKEREYELSPNEYYDKEKKIYFGLADKNDKLNKKNNKEIFENAIENKDVLLRLINIQDGFEQFFFINPKITTGELKTMVSFLYKLNRGIKELRKINLYYLNDLDIEVEINGDELNLGYMYQTLGKNYELVIYINVDY